MPPKKPPGSPALLALTASALAALGSAGEAQAQGAAASEDTEVDYRFSRYSEAALPASQVSGGSGERYTINTHQFLLVKPFGPDDRLSVNLATETMSGASPWYVQPDGDGQPIQVMSGASIEDKRNDVLLGYSHTSGGTTGSISAGYSKEDDYTAANLGLQGEWQLADTVTTFSAGLGHSDDKLEPQPGTTGASVVEADKTSTTAFVGWSRIVGPLTVVQAGLSYTVLDGFLSDPYKLAWVDDQTNTVADSRPAERRQYTFTARLRQFVRGPDAAIHADYRYYHDDWEVDAHTVDLQWHQPVGESVRITPGVRYYSQSQAFFYQPYYATERPDGLASSDYRLAPYGALSLSLSATAEIAGWGLNLRLEDYDSSANYALGEVLVENPGLVDFKIISFGIKKVF